METTILSNDLTTDFAELYNLITTVKAINQSNYYYSTKRVEELAQDSLSEVENNFYALDDIVKLINDKIAIIQEKVE